MEGSSHARFRHSCSQLVFSTPFHQLRGGARIFPLPNDVFMRGQLARDLRISDIKHSLNGSISHRLVQGRPRLTSARLARTNTVISTTYLTRSLNGPPFKRSNRGTVNAFFDRKGNR